MRKPILTLVGVALIASPAFAQVRPQDCRPVFPLVEQVAAVPDVVTEPALPAVAAKKRFLGLPFLLPALLAGGAVGALIDDGGGNNPQAVSPS
jgi:hypothetical protein